jgi:inosine-uridine nucleoside N-ribohydrolase
MGAALELLAASIDAGATLIAIGPYTNLALLEAATPGVLNAASVVAMG